MGESVGVFCDKFQLVLRGLRNRTMMSKKGSANSSLAGISTDNFVRYSYFLLAIIWTRNVKLASSRGFSTDNTHIWDSVCRIAMAKI